MPTEIIGYHDIPLDTQHEYVKVERETFKENGLTTCGFNPPQCNEPAVYVFIATVHIGRRQFGMAGLACAEHFATVVGWTKDSTKNVTVVAEPF